MQTAGTIAASVIAALVGGLGLLFVIGAQGQTSRLVVGVILVLGAGAIVVLGRLRPRVDVRQVVQQVDVAGATTLSRLACPQCNAAVDPSALRAEHGIAVLTCPYCHTTHQLQEDVKW